MPQCFFRVVRGCKDSELFAEKLIFVKDDCNMYCGLLKIETLPVCKRIVKSGLYFCSMNVLPD